MARRRDTKAVLPMPTLDERTKEMSPETLSCRGYNHVWVRRPTPPARLLEMARQGFREERLECAGRCGQSKTVVYSRTTGAKMSEERHCENKDFYVPRGTGRMSPAEARKALWVRQDAALYGQIH